MTEDFSLDTTEVYDRNNGESWTNTHRRNPQFLELDELMGINYLPDMARDQRRLPPRHHACCLRITAKQALSSEVNSTGCSNAAKCPPLATLFQ
jgi:hypothetical protein